MIEKLQKQKELYAKDIELIQQEIARLRDLAIRAEGAMLACDQLIEAAKNEIQEIASQPDPVAAVVQDV